MALLNLIIGFIELVCDKVDVAVQAIKDSNVSDLLLFRNRNESPWVVKENAIPVLKGDHLCYSVNEKRFYNVIGDGFIDFLKMDDIIMAELVDVSGLGVCDMSDFLHSVKWNSSSAPSVYEFVLVNTLLSKLCLSKEYLSNCVLNVTTLQNPLISIALSNPLAKEDFLTWNVFVGPEDQDSGADTILADADADAEAETATEPTVNSLGDSLFIN